MSIVIFPSPSELFKKLDTDPNVVNAWIYATSLGIARRGAGGFIYNKKLYVIGGLTSNGITTTVEIVDLVTLDRYYGSYMDEGRAHFGYVFTGSKFYVIGGIDSSGSMRKEIYEYDPGTDSWSKLSIELPVGIAYCSAVYYNGKIYVIGGINENGDITGDVYEIDIDAGTVSKKSSMNNARQNHTCSELNGFIYCFGGDNGSSPMKDVEKYDPDNDVWEDLGDIMPIALSGISSAKYNGKIIIVGG